MKKRAAPLLILSIILISLFVLPVAFAQDETEPADEIDKAYFCLEDKLEQDCGNTQSTEQTVFSLLAMAHKSGIQSDCGDSLEDKRQGDCWGASPTANCDLKSTAQAVLALNHINKNIDDYIDWLLDKRKLTADLDWFLEIDANEATSCEIKVNEASPHTFTINENKKISGTTTCLSPAEQNYFLKISDSCLDDNFTISCDKDFITTLLYKKPGQDTFYVSSKTNSAPAGGTTQEKVNAYCFAISNTCDYEGSLWTALALAKAREEISDYLPYLTSMYDETENKEYFPSAFLYMLTNEEDYYIDVTEKQKQGKYWQENNNWYYDTALALLSLQNLVLEEVDNAKEYLLTKQDASGCWHSNNVRDTAFILYAWEPKTPVISNGDGRSDCESFGYYCVSPNECADPLDNFYCSGLSDVCCETLPEEQSCDEKGGTICEPDQECTGSEVISSDTNYCCLASCILTTTITECEDYGYVCKTSCSSDEEEKLYDCNFGDVCCTPKAEKPAGWLWMILLIILIILVVLAIIFRNQLKIWLFRFKSKLRFGKPPVGPAGRPPMPPSAAPFLQRPRQIIPRQVYRRPQTRRPAPKKPEKDTLFEETMRKLKDMSK